MTFQFLWNLSFGDISTVNFLLYIVHDKLSTVYWLALSWFYFDGLPIPGALPDDFDIPSQGVWTTKQMNNTPNIEPLQIFSINGWNWGDLEFGDVWSEGLREGLNKRPKMKRSLFYIDQPSARYGRIRTLTLDQPRLRRTWLQSASCLEISSPVGLSPTKLA